NGRAAHLRLQGDVIERLDVLSGTEDCGRPGQELSPTVHIDGREIVNVGPILQKTRRVALTHDRNFTTNLLRGLDRNSHAFVVVQAAQKREPIRLVWRAKVKQFWIDRIRDDDVVPAVTLKLSFPAVMKMHPGVGIENAIPGPGVPVTNSRFDHELL